MTTRKYFCQQYLNKLLIILCGIICLSAQADSPIAYPSSYNTPIRIEIARQILIPYLTDHGFVYVGDSKTSAFSDGEQSLRFIVLKFKRMILSKDAIEPVYLHLSFQINQIDGNDMVKQHYLCTMQTELSEISQREVLRAEVGQLLASTEKQFALHTHGYQDNLGLRCFL